MNFDTLPVLAYQLRKQDEEKKLLGEFEKDQAGNDIHKKNSLGFLLDRHGHQVNEKCEYVDSKGNVIDKDYYTKLFLKDLKPEFLFHAVMSNTWNTEKKCMEVSKNQFSVFVGS